MIYIAGKHLVDSSVHEILKLIKNDAKHSLWGIWEAVWLLPENYYLASISEFKSSRDRLLTLSGVTMYFNSWKFVTVSYFNRLILWKKICSKNNLLVIIYIFSAKLVKSPFDDITYVHVNSIFYSMALILIPLATDFWQRFVTLS